MEERPQHLFGRLVLLPFSLGLCVAGSLRVGPGSAWGGPEDVSTQTPA